MIYCLKETIVDFFQTELSGVRIVRSTIVGVVWLSKARQYRVILVNKTNILLSETDSEKFGAWYYGRD